MRNSSGDFPILCVVRGLRVLDWDGCHNATGEAGGETAVCSKQDYSSEGCGCGCGCVANIIIYTLFSERYSKLV